MGLNFLNKKLFHKLCSFEMIKMIPNYLITDLKNQLNFN
jgi:hypothetical protein